MTHAHDTAADTVVENPCGLRGLEFVEFAASGEHVARLDGLFKAFGFSKTKRHKTKAIDYYNQNGIHFLLNHEPGSFADAFQKAHGPSICALGLRVDDKAGALHDATARGGKPFDGAAHPALNLPAIYGIGDSLLYFVDKWGTRGSWFDEDFVALEKPEKVEAKGFLAIDHLTNNVHKGTLGQWSDFYKTIFGFTEVRHFDIRGEKTGLFSYALRSPDGSFCIPINEGTEAKSQIEEYLREYHGPGIQHLAFISGDLLASLDKMEGSSVEFLDIDDDYYAEVFNRVPGVTEDHAHIKRHNVLVDGDDEGYLLQIFTKNLIGPIFIELIQRKNHQSFGEGNFGALFRSIERDQEKRGVL